MLRHNCYLVHDLLSSQISRSVHYTTQSSKFNPPRTSNVALNLSVGSNQCARIWFCISAISQGSDFTHPFHRSSKALNKRAGQSMASCHLESRQAEEAHFECVLSSVRSFRRFKSLSLQCQSCAFLTPRRIATAKYTGLWTRGSVSDDGPMRAKYPDDIVVDLTRAIAGPTRSKKVPRSSRNKCCCVLHCCSCLQNLVPEWKNSLYVEHGPARCD